MKTNYEEEFDFDDDDFNTNEAWYVLNIVSTYHDSIMREITKIAYRHAVEINFFNPHWIPKSKKKNQEYGFGRAMRSSQMYDGYIYMYLSIDSVKDVENDLKSVNGVIKLLKPALTQEEFDEAFHTVMKMYKEFKSPIKRKIGMTKADLRLNQTVKIIEGQLEGFKGQIRGLSKGGEMLKIAVKFLGTETSVLLSPTMVEALDGI